MKKSVLIKIVGVIVTLFVAFGIWFQLTYSMDESTPTEVNDSKLSTKLLIASQGSEYKEILVSKLINHFKKVPIYIKVIDVGELPQMNPQDWAAICLIHTWEFGEGPSPLREFIPTVKDRKKLVVHTTSGDGDYKLDSLDAISGASVLENIPQKSTILIKRLELLLNVN